MINYDESLDSRAYVQTCLLAEALEYAFERLLTNYSCLHTKVTQFIYALDDAFGGRVRLVFIGELSLCLCTNRVDYFVSIAKNEYGDTLYDRINYELNKIGGPTPAIQEQS